MVTVKNIGGIQFHINGDLNDPRLARLIHRARLDMQQLYRMQPDADIKMLKRAGLFDLRSTFGFDQAFIDLEQVSKKGFKTQRWENQVTVSLLNVAWDTIDHESWPVHFYDTHLRAEGLVDPQQNYTVYEQYCQQRDIEYFVDNQIEEFAPVHPIDGAQLRECKGYRNYDRITGGDVTYDYTITYLCGDNNLAVGKKEEWTFQVVVTVDDVPVWYGPMEYQYESHSSGGACQEGDERVYDDSWRYTYYTPGITRIGPVSFAHRPTDPDSDTEADLLTDCTHYGSIYNWGACIDSSCWVIAYEYSDNIGVGTDETSTSKYYLRFHDGDGNEYELLLGTEAPEDYDVYYHVNELRIFETLMGNVFIATIQRRYIPYEGDEYYFYDSYIVFKSQGQWQQYTYNVGADKSPDYYGWSETDENGDRHYLLATFRLLCRNAVFQCDGEELVPVDQ